MNGQRKPVAFISCSLRPEDEAFTNWIISMTEAFGFEVKGAVGKISAAPQSPVAQMRAGMVEADCVVVAATPRYLQADFYDRRTMGTGISEMLQAEVGMAFMSDLPVLVFSQKDTNLGPFIPAVVQYIEIDAFDANDIGIKWPLIANYFRSALSMIYSRWNKQSLAGWAKAGFAVLGVIGTATVIDALSSQPPKKPRRNSKRTAYTRRRKGR